MYSKYGSPFDLSMFYHAMVENSKAPIQISKHHLRFEKKKPDCRTSSSRGEAEPPSPIPITSPEAEEATVTTRHAFAAYKPPPLVPFPARTTTAHAHDARGRHGHGDALPPPPHLAASQPMAVARLRVAAAARLQPALAAGGRGERRPLGTAAEVATATGAGAARWELMGAREYYDYRRAMYGDITHKAILVDAAGTLLAPTEPMAQVRAARPRLPQTLPPIAAAAAAARARLRFASSARWVACLVLHV